MGYCRNRAGQLHGKLAFGSCRDAILRCNNAADGGHAGKDTRCGLIGPFPESVKAREGGRRNCAALTA